MSTDIIISYFKTPVGELILGAYENTLCLCDWRYRRQRHRVDKRITSGLKADYLAGDTAVIEETKTQLNAYFKGERDQFNLPLTFVGSEFQKMVWHTLMTIPYGQTSTYLKLSNQLNNPAAIRAVAAANGANAISIIVPCHRIIGSNGDLVGYAGGLTAKQNLLKLEGALISDQLELF